MEAGVIPLAFGAAAPEPIRKELLSFYEWLVCHLTGSGCKIFKKNETTTLAISVQDYSARKAYALIDEKIESFGDHVDVVIIDISNIPAGFIPGQTEVHMAQAISCSIIQKQKPNLFIILQPELPPEREPVREILQQHIDHGRVVLIDDSGAILSVSTFEKTFDSNQYYVQLINAREDPFELVKLKMIRRLGHFRRNTEDQCIRYFYDGSICESELTILISRFLSDAYKEVNTPLLYYSESSQWLKFPLIAVAESRGAPYGHVKDDFLKNPVEYLRDESIPPFLVFPLIDTGNTLATIMEEWYSKGLPSPVILTILTTRGSDDHQGSFDLELEGRIHKINYFLNVERRACLSKECPMCKSYIPLSSPGAEEFFMLTAYDLYEMADQAGWITESASEVPPNRKALSLIPDFHRIIHMNGPWLAQKAAQRMIAGSKDFPASPVLVICPRERGADALAVYLQVMQGFTIVRVSKKAIECTDFLKINKDEIEIKENIKKWENEPWYIQLNSASPGQRVVLLEEFCVSGGTRDGMFHIASHFGLEVLCHFALVNFNYKSLSDIVPTLSLYDLYLPWENN